MNFKKVKSRGKRFTAGVLALLMAVTLLQANTLSIVYAEETDVIEAALEAEASDSIEAVEEEMQETDESISQETGMDEGMNEEIPQEEEETQEADIDEGMDEDIPQEEEETQATDRDAETDEEILQVNEEEPLEAAESEIVLYSGAQTVGFRENGRPTLSISGEGVLGLNWPKPGDTLTVSYILDRTGTDISTIRWYKTNSEGTSEIAGKDEVPLGRSHCSCGYSMDYYTTNVSTEWALHMREHLLNGEKHTYSDQPYSSVEAAKTAVSKTLTITEDLIGCTIIAEVTPGVQYSNGNSPAGEPAKTEPTGAVVEAGFEPIWNQELIARDIPNGTYDDTIIKTGFTIRAGADSGSGEEKGSKTVTVENSNKTIDGVDYTARLRLGGVGTRDYRSIQFTTGSKAAALKMICVSASDEEPSRLGIGMLSQDEFTEFTGRYRLHDGVEKDYEAGGISIDNRSGIGSTKVSTVEADLAADTTYCIYTAAGSGISFYAVYVTYEGGADARYYTATFDARGGTAVAPQRALSGECYLKPSSVREGYRLNGWYQNPNYIADGYEYSFKGKVSGNEHFYAGWTADDTETGDGEGGVLEFIREPELSIAQGTSGTENLDLTAPQEGDVLAVDYTLDLAGGSTDASVITWYRTRDGAMDEVIKTGGAVDDGMKSYTVTKADVGYRIRAEVSPKDSEEHTGAAKSAETGTVIVIYIISFNLQGYGSLDDIKVISGNKIEKPADPTALGYAFTGWYKDPGCTKKWNFEDTVTTDMTLYAGWRVVSTVSAPFASILSGSEVEAGTEVSLSTATAGARIYYTTDGSDPDVSGILYKDVIIINSDVTIRAVAVKNGYIDSAAAEFTYTLKDESKNWGDLTEEDQKLYENPDEIPDSLWVAGIPDNTDYTGKTITFNIRVYDHKRLLKNKTDYTVSYKNHTNAADKNRVAASKAPTVTVTGKGNYSGSIVTYFTINPIDISVDSHYAEEFAVNDVLRAYTRKVQKVASALKRNGKALKSGKDYTISYDAISDVNGEAKRVYQDAGTYQITVTGKGNYTGKRVYYESIVTETLMSKASVSAIKNQKYKGEAITPAFRVTYNKKPLTGMEASEYEKLLKEAEQDEELETECQAVDYIYVFADNQEVGTASLTLTGVNQYIGTVTKTFKITGTALKDCSLTGFRKTSAYTGEEILQNVSFRYSSGKGSSKVTYDLVGMSAAEYEQAGTEQKAGADYIYEYRNNTEVGTATVIYTGVNGYTGTIKKTYKITGISMQNVKVQQFKSSFVYTGEEIKQGSEVKLSYQTGKGANLVVVPLTEGRDYVVTYQNNIKAGTATVIYKGTGKYTGTIKKTYKITAYNLKTDADHRITVTYDSSVVYAKGGAAPAPVVTYSYNGESTVLTAGKDYTVSYTDNKAASGNSKKTPLIYIQGKGSFSGKLQAGSFTIAKQDLEQLVITVPDIVYKNKANIYKAVPVLTDLNGKKLVSNTDYDKKFVYEYAEDTEVTQLVKKKSVIVTRREGETVDASDIIPVGARIRITVTGKNNYEGTISEVFRFVKGNLSSTSASVAAQYYTGKTIRPGKDQITIKLGKTVLSETDYEIVGYQNNVKKGTAKVTLRGVGNYGGTKTVSFKILNRTMGCLIKFDGNGSTSGSMSNQTIVSNIIGKPLTGNQYKKTGYRFVGWNTEKDGSGTGYANKARFSNGFQQYGMSVTLYAQWELESYKISYVLNSGMNASDNPADYTVESDTIILQNPVREGYSFVGWYLDSKYKKKVSEISGGSTGNKKLYAKWKKL